MSSSSAAEVRYVYVDVERFSVDRSAEAQAGIIVALNRIVSDALRDLAIPQTHRILLPTGDGLCIAITDHGGMYDVHVRLAISILTRLDEYNSAELSAERRFRLRVGVNQNVDILVTDINGNPNVAGPGVNLAQRVMSIAGGNQLLISAAVHETVHAREQYRGAFKEHQAFAKHGQWLYVYQYVRAMRGIDTGMPAAIKREWIDAGLDVIPLLPVRTLLKIFGKRN